MSFSCPDASLADMLSLAQEFGYEGIEPRTGGIHAHGVELDTSADDRMRMLDVARAKNPAGRLTVPEDIAKAIVVMCDDNASFISGNVIGVDGGEDVVSFVGQRPHS